MFSTDEIDSALAVNASKVSSLNKIEEEAASIPTENNLIDQATQIDEDKPETEKETLPTTHDLEIDPALHSLIPPLTDGEYTVLKENIVKDGCREPLTIWKDHNTILDGHNRYKICKEGDHHYEVVEIELPDRTAAQIWIIKNQRGRRNLNESQRAMLAVKLEALYAEQAKERQGQRTDLGQKLDQSKAGRSAEKAAKDMGVSHQTVSSAKKVSTNGIPELSKIVESGDLSVSAAAKVTPFDDQTQAKIVEKVQTQIKEGKRPKVKAIIDEIAPKEPKNISKKHFEKVSKNLKVCLNLLADIEATENQENLAELQDVIQKISNRLKEIGEKSPDPVNHNTDSVPGNPGKAINEASKEADSDSLSPDDCELEVASADDSAELTENNCPMDSVSGLTEDWGNYRQAIENENANQGEW